LLVPSEFLDVNYGVVVQQFLLQNVVLTRIHLFESEDVQFDDALVSSAVVWYKKGRATKDHFVEFSYGGSLLNPAYSRIEAQQSLHAHEKWTPAPSLSMSTST
jgi:adenine-specific DNA-methyltransferase